jgi:hypothetical protein
MIAWLLLFIGSLEYQLNPNLFTKDTEYCKTKQLQHLAYKCPEYYESKVELEKLLAS